MSGSKPGGPANSWREAESAEYVATTVKGSTTKEKLARDDGRCSAEAG
jgi:hypothetical protein